jgi:hypothetical protein
MQSPAVCLTCYPLVILLYVSSDDPVRHEVPAAARDALISAALCAAGVPRRTWRYYVPMWQADGKPEMPNPVVIDQIPSAREVMPEPTVTANRHCTTGSRRYVV